MGAQATSPTDFNDRDASQWLIARCVPEKYRLLGISARRTRISVFLRLKMLRYLISEPSYVVQLNLIVRNFVTVPGNTHIRNLRSFLILLVYRNAPKGGVKRSRQMQTFCRLEIPLYAHILCRAKIIFIA